METGGVALKCLPLAVTLDSEMVKRRRVGVSDPSGLLSLHSIAVVMDLLHFSKVMSKYSALGIFADVTCFKGAIDHPKALKYAR